MLGLGPDLEHQLARRVEDAGDRQLPIGRRSAVALLSVHAFSLALQFVQVLVEPVEALVPETAVVLQPAGDILERARRPAGRAATAPRARA